MSEMENSRSKEVSGFDFHSNMSGVTSTSFGHEGMQSSRRKQMAWLVMQRACFLAESSSESSTRPKNLDESSSESSFYSTRQKLVKRSSRASLSSTRRNSSETRPIRVESKGPNGQKRPKNARGSYA